MLSRLHRKSCLPHKPVLVEVLLVDVGRQISNDGMVGSLDKAIGLLLIRTLKSAVYPVRFYLCGEQKSCES